MLFLDLHTAADDDDDDDDDGGGGDDDVFLSAPAKWGTRPEGGQLMPSGSSRWRYRPWDHCKIPCG